MSSTLEARTSDSAELLTQITGQEVLSHQLTPRIVFLSSMATVLVGVAYADGRLADREKVAAFDGNQIKVNQAAMEELR